MTYYHEWRYTPKVSIVLVVVCGLCGFPRLPRQAPPPRARLLVASFVFHFNSQFLTRPFRDQNKSRFFRILTREQNLSTNQTPVECSSAVSNKVTSQKGKNIYCLCFYFIYKCDVLCIFITYFIFVGLFISLYII